MIDHYYSENPQVKHDEREITTRFFNKDFTFETDAGVFSKKQVDFGSALLINTVDVKDHLNILDLGCGYGPIGITIASKLAKGKVLLVDINQRAVDLANKNLKRNLRYVNKNVEIKSLQSNGFTNIKEEVFDLILFNPPIRTGKNNIYQLFEEAFDHLKSNGELWIVIQKKQGANSAFEKLASKFSEVEEVEKKKGYSIIKAIK